MEDTTTVPESILKRRQAYEKVVAARAAQRETQLKKRKDSAVVAFKRAEQYALEYLQKEREEIRMKRVARSTGDFYVPSEPKLAFVVRIKG